MWGDFSLMNYGSRRVPVIPMLASAVLHLLFLAWLLHKPAPRFVSPSSVASGEGGSSLTYLFHTDSAGASQANAMQKQQVFWRTERHSPKVRPKGRLPESRRVETENHIEPTSATAAPPAGSRFGSLPGSVYTGHEVRPALRVSGSEPIVASNELRGAEGNVVIEITIDEHGSIVAKNLVRGISPSVDNKVLAALEDWHFLPATEDGVAIPSKEDVYYHFPVRR